MIKSFNQKKTELSVKSFAVDYFQFIWKLVFIFIYLFITNNLLSDNTQQSDINFSTISIYQGLPSTTVFAIHQDKFGFIWFGTREGLVRFDGKNIKDLSYLSTTDFSLTGKMITAINEDENGNLYIGVWESGLYYYKRKTGTLEKIQIMNQTPANDPVNVWKILKGEDGELYVGTTNHGLFVKPPKSLELIQLKSDFPEMDPVNITSLLLDSQNRLWIGSTDQGLVLYDLKKHFQNNKLPENQYNFKNIHANYLHEDSHKNIWIGTKSSGLYCITSDEQTLLAEKVSTHFDEFNIRAITSDDHGNIWIGTDGDGLYIFDYKQNKLSQSVYLASKPNGISSNTIFCLFKDNFGSMWIGTNKGGVNVAHLQKNNFSKSSSILQAFSNMMVMSVMQDKTGKIWIGTDGNGYCIIDNSTADSKMPEFSFTAGKAIKSIFEDSKGNIYFGTYGNGMSMIQTGNKTIKNFVHDVGKPNSLSQNDVWSFTEDENGNIWVGTLNGGLNLFNSDECIFEDIDFLKNDEKKQINNILSIKYDWQHKILWIGCTNGLFALTELSGQPKLENISKNKVKALSGAEIKSLMIDSENYIWIGTRGQGVIRYHPKKEDYFITTEDNGLISNYIASVTEDQEGYIWIASSKGLSRFDPKSNKISNYQTDEGLQVNEYLSESFANLRSGEIIFGGVYGLDLINPTSVKENTHIPSVYFTKLTIMNQEIIPSGEKSLIQTDIAFTESISLKHSDNIISLDFIAINYQNPDKNKYAYKLEGFDEKWNIIGKQRHVTFTNLDPGKYILHIQASSEDGLWNEMGSKLIIVVTPPWWKTVTARILFGVFLISLIIALYIRKNNMHIKRRRELEKEVRQRTSELQKEKLIVENQNAELLKIKEKLTAQNLKISKQKDDIKEISEKLHLADQQKINFFTNISHEIRTPLTLMISPLSRLIKKYGNHDEHLHSQLNLIQRNQHNLLELVNQLLDFHKIENQSLKLRTFPHDIVLILNDIKAAYDDQAVSRNIDFLISVKDELPEIWVDVEKFKKIINNLLSNAFKFTQANDKIEIIIEKSVSNDFTANSLINIDVKDTGVGIPADKLPYVFDRFFQTEAAQNSGLSGTGIGLTIAKKMAELHHGTLTVESDTAKGSCFRLVLPIGNRHLKNEEILLQLPVNNEINYSYDSSHQYQSDSNDLISASKEIKKPKLLIVEDNNELRAYIQSCLKQEFIVYEADNGEVGLSKTIKYLPDLVISDVLMPKMDGLQMLAKIKTDKRTSHIPVILLTARSLSQHKIEGLETGADDYLLKPFDFDELIARIDNLLKSRKIIRNKFKIDAVSIPDNLLLTGHEVDFFNKINTILELNYTNENFNVTSLVDELLVSRSQLHIKLKEIAGVSASEFLRSFRLKKAAIFLSQDKTTVSEVAFRTGFSDTAYFNRCFKQQFGITPGEYSNQQTE